MHRPQHTRNMSFVRTKAATGFCKNPRIVRECECAYHRGECELFAEQPKTYDKHNCVEHSDEQRNGYAKVMIHYNRNTRSSAGDKASRSMKNATPIAYMKFPHTTVSAFHRNSYKNVARKAGISVFHCLSPFIIIKDFTCD